MNVAYLGPDGSYSSQAARRRFGDDACFVPQRTIDAVFDAVHRSECRFGIVPVENTTDGRIIDTMVGLTRYPVSVVAEVELSVRHALLARGGIDSVQEVHSKQQAISQCREWLARTLPNATLCPAESTTAAALLAAERDDVAAIAPEEFATVCGLRVVATKIQDDPENRTRFLVLSEKTEQPSLPTGRDRSIVLLKLPHRCGALADALGIFRVFEISLSRIESFPVRGMANLYWFYIEFDGHRDSPQCHAVLETLRLFATQMILPGSFDTGEN